MQKSVHDIANWFLSRDNRITNKKLQKLVYYAYAWYLVMFNETEDDLSNKLFDNHFEAWVHGAVCPELHWQYRDYGARYIPTYTGTLPEFSDDERDCLEQVWDVYGGYNGNQLESICHQEPPWKEQRVGLQPYEPGYNVMSDKTMFRYYLSQTDD